MHFNWGFLFKYLNLFKFKFKPGPLWFFLKNNAWKLGISVLSLQVAPFGSLLPLEHHPDEGLKIPLEQIFSVSCSQGSL